MIKNEKVIENEKMKYEVRDGIGILRMDDGRANAIQPEWCNAMNEALDRVEQGEVSSLVIAGRPGFFSGGLDLGVFPKLEGDALREATSLFMSTVERLFLFPKPILAASTGHTIAGGMVVFLAADYRLAVDDPRHQYGLNEAINGVPLLGGTMGICQISIPTEHHPEMILHGRILTARECFDRRVIHALAADPEVLLKCAFERAKAIENIDPGAYRINKIMLRRRALDEATRITRDLMSEAPIGNVFGKMKPR